MIRKLSCLLALLGLVVFAGAAQAQQMPTRTYDVHASVMGLADTADGVILYELIDVDQTIKFRGHTYNWAQKSMVVQNLSAGGLLGWASGDSLYCTSMDSDHATYEGWGYGSGGWQPFQFEIDKDANAPSGWSVSFSSGGFDDAGDALRAGSGVTLNP
jgi:hypothetical protein